MGHLALLVRARARRGVQAAAAAAVATLLAAAAWFGAVPHSVSAGDASVNVPILMYHYVRINPVASDRLGFELSVTPQNFAAQMALLRAEGAHTVSLADVMRALQGGPPLPARPVVLTFDDGYEDFASAALPVLRQNGIAATAFIVPGFLDRVGYLSHAELRQVVAAGITIGAHTMHHRDLVAVDPALARQEIDDSRTTLRRLTGQPVDDFAYPYGANDGAVVAMVHDAGFRDAVTTEGGTLQTLGDHFRFHREHVNGSDSLSSFAAKAGIGVSQPATLLPSASGGGYDVIDADGASWTYGDATALPSLASLQLVQPVVAGAATPTHHGAWLAAGDGGVLALGDAHFHGSAGHLRLNSPVVGIAPTPTGAGYWLAASDGGVFAFGDAAFHGSMDNRPLDAPVVGIAATPTGAGYWLVAADGGIFAFGDAAFHGSMGGHPLDRPVIAITATPDGGGYWLLASDGGVFALGDAPFHGGAAASGLGILAMAADSDGDGYWLLASDRQVFAYGSAAVAPPQAAHPQRPHATR